MDENKKKLIERILYLCHKSKEGHIASSLSVLDILIVLYNKIINNNDKFILSKGHASLALYVVLESINKISNLDSFCEFDSEFGGHPSIYIPEVVCSTGSLGHGFPIAVGIALGKKISKNLGIVYAIIGDGEANEGTIWESALVASHHKLNNLVCILDHNRSTNRALNIDNTIEKFKSFGWDTLEIDGHNHEQIEESLILIKDKPLFILAKTTKGKGCDIMENNPEWHHKSPDLETYNKLIEDINNG
jgi:transketolase